ncbi:hypothetical protein ACSS6W_002616 [Trichoderma asperelloides]
MEEKQKGRDGDWWRRLGLPSPYRRGRRNGSEEEAEAKKFRGSGWMDSGVREWGGKYGKQKSGGRE